MREASPDISRLWELVALEIVIVLVGEMLARASILVESLLGELFSNYTNMRLMEHAATLDLYHFEDHTFYDRLERARRQLDYLRYVGASDATAKEVHMFRLAPWLVGRYRRLAEHFPLQLFPTGRSEALAPGNP